MKAAKSYKKRFTTVIVLCMILLSAALAVALLNCFVPIIYLSSYMVGKDVNESEIMRVTYLDVGYGDCTLIELPDGKTALIDCGYDTYDNTKTLLRALNERRIDKIDYFICTSVNDEHCSGFAGILKFRSAETALIPYSKNRNITNGYREMMTAFKENGVKYGYAASTGGFYSDEYGYFLTVLSPTEPSDSTSAYNEMNNDPTPTNKDNASAIVWLEYGGVGFVFSSDARKGALNKVVQSYAFSQDVGQPFMQTGQYSVKLENCKFVTMAGHGSEDNVCPEWYGALSPEVAVVSVGKNYEGCPSATVVADVQKYCRLHNTGLDGRLIVTVSGGGTYSME